MLFSSTRVFQLRRTTLSRAATIAIGIKQVVDHSIKVRVKDGKVQTASLKRSLNPFDEIALEEAVRMKEKGTAKELVAITIGPAKGVEVLRSALAMGCDKAIHIVQKDPDAILDSLAVAQVFAALHAELKPDLWLLGKQAIDDDFGCTPPLLAGVLDLPLASFASKVEMKDKRLAVTREVDAGMQMVEVPLPCVLSVDLRLNTPRFLKLPSIMKARKKPIDTRDISSFKIDIPCRFAIQSVVEPAAKKAGERVKSVDELVEKLKSQKLV